MADKLLDLNKLQSSKDQLLDLDKINQSQGLLAKMASFGGMSAMEPVSTGINVGKQLVGDVGSSLQDVGKFYNKYIGKHIGEQIPQKALDYNISQGIGVDPSKSSPYIDAIGKSVLPTMAALAAPEMLPEIASSFMPARMAATGASQAIFSPNHPLVAGTLGSILEGATGRSAAKFNTMKAAADKLQNPGLLDKAQNVIQDTYDGMKQTAESHLGSVKDAIQNAFSKIVSGRQGFESQLAEHQAKPFMDEQKVDITNPDNFEPVSPDFNPLSEIKGASPNVVATNMQKWLDNGLIKPKYTASPLQSILNPKEYEFLQSPAWSKYLKNIDQDNTIQAGRELKTALSRRSMAMQNDNDRYIARNIASKLDKRLQTAYENSGGEDAKNTYLNYNKYLHQNFFPFEADQKVMQLAHGSVRNPSASDITNAIDGASEKLNKYSRDKQSYQYPSIIPKAHPLTQIRDAVSPLAEMESNKTISQVLAGDKDVPLDKLNRALKQLQFDGENPLGSLQDEISKSLEASKEFAKTPKGQLGKQFLAGNIGEKLARKARWHPFMKGAAITGANEVQEFLKSHNL
jgi:hypothetical protein